MITHGIDGCSGGWCLATLHWEQGNDAPTSWNFQVFSTLLDLQSHIPKTEIVLVDMPLGLPHTGAQVRRCDQVARKLLKGRGSSVFSPACREALAAADYRQACEANKRIIGRKISLQSWSIGRKIRELDILVRERSLADTWLEAHPELCFAGLSGAPLLLRKRTAEGLEYRLRLLEKHVPRSRELYHSALDTWPRKKLARDDVLDALVLALAGAPHLKEQLRAIPQAMGEPPQFDVLGLPMRIYTLF